MEEDIFSCFLPGFCILGFFIVAIIPVYFITKRHELDFTFEIGEKEKHTIRFFFETFIGRVQIYVDGIKKHSSLKMINGDASFNLVVGQEEVHNLLFQIKMPFLYGAFRERSVFVYDNNTLIKTVVSGQKV